MNNFLTDPVFEIERKPMANIMLAAAVACGIVFVVLSIMISHQVAKRGVKVNILFLRFFVIKYAHQYKQFTEEETGKIGPLLYPWIVSINTALVLAIVSSILLIF